MLLQLAARAVPKCSRRGRKPSLTALHRFMGKGVSKAVGNINTLIDPALKVVRVGTARNWTPRAQLQFLTSGLAQPTASPALLCKASPPPSQHVCTWQHAHVFARTEGASTATRCLLFLSTLPATTTIRPGPQQPYPFPLPPAQGMDPTKQAEVDQRLRDLDGTDNMAKLGANAVVAVSVAVCKVRH